MYYLNYFAKYLARKIDLSNLVKLLEINSYSTNRTGVNRKLDFIESLLKGLPLKITRTPSKTYGDFTVIKTEKNNLRKPMVGLVFHVDTAHKLENVTPIKIAANKITGPGVQDMQASIFVMIEVLWLLDLEKRLNNLVIIINSSEEKGSPEFQPQFKKATKELDYLLVYKTGTNSSLIEDPKFSSSDFCLVSSRKGMFQQVLETVGPGGHSGELSTERDRKNAILEAAMMLKAITSLEDFRRETTINIAYISGGQESTTIAENCKFMFDVRFRYESEGERLKKTINKIISKEFIPGVKTVNHGYSADLPPLQPNANTEALIKIVTEVATNLGYSITSAPRGGWSDVCNLYKYNPKLYAIDGLGPKGFGQHTKNEFVYIDSIDKSIQLSVNLIRTLQENYRVSKPKSSQPGSRQKK